MVDNNSIRIYEQQLKELEEREVKLMAELKEKNEEIPKYEQVLEYYKTTLAEKYTLCEKIIEEEEVNKKHLDNMELAFSDLHTKYLKAKDLVLTMKENEEALKEALVQANRNIAQIEERYESLKSHAIGQLDKANRELVSIKDHYDTECGKLRAVAKRLEIKCQSLDVALLQKTEECKQLSALCDEVTGKHF